MLTIAAWLQIKHVINITACIVTALLAETLQCMWLVIMVLAACATTMCTMLELLNQRKIVGIQLQDMFELQRTKYSLYTDIWTNHEAG